MLDYDTWQTRFGGDEGVLGRTALLDGRTIEFVGVLPRGFRLATGRGAPKAIDIYTPYRLQNFRNAWQFPTLARLAPERSFEEVQLALDSLAAGLKIQYPEFYEGALRYGHSGA